MTSKPRAAGLQLGRVELNLIKPDGKVLLREGLAGVVGTQKGEDAYWRIVRRIGEEPVTVLGHGEYGVVYGLLSGKVLKVTSDEGELLAMNLLKGRKHPNIAQVFDVFQVPIIGSNQSAGVVVRESVDGTLADAGHSPRLVRLLMLAVVLANDVYRKKLETGTSRQAIQAAMAFFENEIVGPAAANLMPWERAFLPGIGRAIGELHELGIYVLDLKATNIGLIDQQPVLFDLSRASVPLEAPDLELGRRRP